jgi:hypothetical protein
LEILDSPTLKGLPVDPIALERAVQACRLSYPTTVSPKLNLWSMRWRLAGRDLNNEVRKFGVYLSDYFAIPKFVPPLKKKHVPDTVNHPPPENMAIFSAISAMSGWDAKFIWDLPIGQAYWYAAGHWYQSGQELDFLTPEHLLLKERIAAMKANKQNAS